jgi:hypothetical protein
MNVLIGTAGLQSEINEYTASQWHYRLAAQSQSGRPNHITKDNPAVFAAGLGVREHINIVFILT